MSQRFDHAASARLIPTPLPTTSFLRLAGSEDDFLASVTYGNISGNRCVILEVRARTGRGSD